MREVEVKFAVLWSAIQKEIPFNERWNNGTGYFSHAVVGNHAPKLSPGERVKSMDNRGRAIIMVGTKLGNAVVFDRGVTGEDKVYVMNAPHCVNAAFDLNGPLDANKISFVVGDEMSNSPCTISDRVDAMIRAVKYADQRCND